MDGLITMARWFSDNAHFLEGVRCWGLLQRHRPCAGVPAKWSSVTESPSHHDSAIPLLSPYFVCMSRSL